MLEKIFVPILFVVAQFLIAWYGDFSGKLAAKGTYLGMSYNSGFLRSIFTQFEYLWIIIIINVLFSFGFNLGFNSYKDFLIIAVIWMASGPIAALLYNSLILKEKLDVVVIGGILLVVFGAIAVVAHKEIAKILNIA